MVAFIITPVTDLHAPREEHLPTRKTQHARPLMKEKHFVLAVAAQSLM